MMDTTLAQLLNHIFELEMEIAQIREMLKNPPAGIDALPPIEEKKEE